GARAIKGEHPIGFELEEILRVEILGPFQRTTGQSHSAEWQRTGHVGNRVGDAVRTRLGDCGAEQGNRNDGGSICGAWGFLRHRSLEKYSMGKRSWVTHQTPHVY